MCNDQTSILFFSLAFDAICVIGCVGMTCWGFLFSREFVQLFINLLQRVELSRPDSLYGDKRYQRINVLLYCFKLTNKISQLFFLLNGVLIFSNLWLILRPCPWPRSRNVLKAFALGRFYCDSRLCSRPLFFWLNGVIFMHSLVLGLFGFATRRMISVLDRGQSGILKGVHVRSLSGKNTLNVVGLN